jgi:hypothetical protein
MQGFFDAKTEGHRIMTVGAVDDGGTLKREQSN